MTGAENSPTALTLTGSVLHSNVVQAGTIVGDVTFAAAPAAPLMVPWQLPPYGRWVDRQPDLERLTTLLLGPGTPPEAAAPTVVSAPRRTRVVLLTGAPGSGKTTLATGWGHSHVTHFPDGQLYAVPARSSSETLAEFLRALGVTDVPANLADRVKLWRSHTYRLRLLIVLDDVGPDTNALDIIPTAPHSATVVATRYDLPTFIAKAGAHLHRVGPLPDFAARDLLAQFAGPARAEAQPQALDDLCADAAGNADVLTLIGTQLALRPEQPITAVQAAMRNALSQPTSASSNTGIWSIAMTVACDNLSDDARSLEGLLAAVPRRGNSFTFTPTIAATLLDRSTKDTMPLLHELMTAGRVRVGPGQRYLLALERVASHSGQLPQPPTQPDLHSAFTRLSADCIRYGLLCFVVKIEPGKRRESDAPESFVQPFATDDDAFNWFTAERDNVLALQHWCCAHGQEQIGIEIADLGWVACRQRGDADAQLSLQREAARAAERIDHGYASLAWSRMAHAHIDLEQAQAAEAACDRAVELAPRADDPRFAMAAAVSTRSTARLRGGDKLGADDDVEKGYQLDVDRHSPMWVIGLRLRRSALIKLALGRREFAVADAYAAIALTRRDPRRRRELARCYMVAAEVQLGIDTPAEAIPLLTNALNIYSEHPQAIHEGETHELLERAYAQIGRNDRAAEHNRKAFSLYTQCGQPRKAEVVAIRLGNYPG